MASSRTQREHKALLRDDKYVSPPVTATTRSGKVYKTDAPVRLSKSRYYRPAMEADSKVESVTEVAERNASSVVSQQTAGPLPAFEMKSDHQKVTKKRRKNLLVLVALNDLISTRGNQRFPPTILPPQVQ